MIGFVYCWTYVLRYLYTQVRACIYVQKKRNVLYSLCHKCWACTTKYIDMYMYSPLAFSCRIEMYTYSCTLATKLSFISSLSHTHLFPCFHTLCLTQENSDPCMNSNVLLMIVIKCELSQINQQVNCLLKARQSASERKRERENSLFAVISVRVWWVAFGCPQ